MKKQFGNTVQLLSKLTDCGSWCAAKQGNLQKRSIQTNRQQNKTKQNKTKQNKTKQTNKLTNE